MTEAEYDRLYKDIKRDRLTNVEEYLNRGGDPSLSSSGGWSLLMATAFLGSSRILALLMDYGAGLEAATVMGETALALAVGRGHTKCVKLLLAGGASVSIRPLGHPLSTYMEYCGGPYPNIQKLLAEAGAD